MIIMFVVFLVDFDAFAKYLNDENQISHRKTIAILLGVYVAVFVTLSIAISFDIYYQRLSNDFEKLVSIEVHRISRSFDTRPELAFPVGHLSLNLSDDDSLPSYDQCRQTVPTARWTDKNEAPESPDCPL